MTITTKPIRLGGACDDHLASFMAGYQGKGLTEEEALSYMSVGNECYWCLCREFDNGIFADPHPRCQVCSEQIPCGCPVVGPFSADRAKPVRS